MLFNGCKRSPVLADAKVALIKSLQPVDLAVKRLCSYGDRMMRVLRFYTDVDVWSTLMPEESDQELFDLEVTKKRGSRWKAPRVKMSAVSRAQHGDIRDLHQAQWAVSSKAAQALQSWFIEAGELLPIKVDDGSELFWFNCTRVIDALDVDACEIDFDEVVTYAFKPQQLKGVGLFRLPAVMKLDPDDTDTWLYSYYQFLVESDESRDSFLTMVKAHKLKGFELREVWRSQRS